MLTINKVTYHLGERTLYHEASLQVVPGQKIGLVGLNGTGKTTLLRLINGHATPDSGEIIRAKDCTLGYLNQDLLSFESEEPILEVAMKAFKEAVETHHEMDRVLEKMEAEYSDKLLERLSRLQEKYERLDGYRLQAKAEEVLEGMGFSTADLKRPLKEFSGGWRMRVVLAKLLLESPSLLMLDEPTNHLDLPSIQWLEAYLNSYPGAVIIVSHDREFLDRTITTTVEVIRQQLEVYKGNYSFYLEEKAQREELQKNAFQNQQQQIKQMEAFVERFRAKSSKAKQAQSKIKALERMDRIDDVDSPSASMNLRFPVRRQPGRFLVALSELNKHYGDLEVLENTDAQIERGQKIALIGANGIGKSTMLRIVAGTEPCDGIREEGYHVHTSFYAQHQLEDLHIDNTILEEVLSLGTGRSEMELRSLLGNFLFTEEDVFKPIRVLSGGEKSRVALAKVLLAEGNFLLLDEPTNHLDMQSVEVLVDALNHYEGSLLLVSHDRHFIRLVANTIWYIENKQVKEYPGTYEEFLYWREKQNQQQASPEQSKAKPKREKKAPAPAPPNKQRDKKLKQLETKLEKLEAQKASLESKMAEPEVLNDHPKLLEMSREHQVLQTEIDQVQEKWLKLAED